METKMEILKFQPFHSSADVSFWQKLAKLKLNHFKLDDKPQDLLGFFELSSHVDVPARLCVDATSFSTLPDEQQPQAEILSASRLTQEWRAPGILYNSNTLEAFKKQDKKELLLAMRDKIWNAIETKEVMKNPNVLNSFLLCTFADLKTHRFVYWFAFPALLPPPSQPFLASVPKKIDDVFTKSEQYEVMLQLKQKCVLNSDDQTDQRNFPAFFVVAKNHQSKEMSIYQFDDLISKGKKGDEYYFAFVDPCSLPTNPGWPLRNYLIFLSNYLLQFKSFFGEIKHVHVLSFRDKLLLEDFDCESKSLVFYISIGEVNVSPPRVTGWETNNQGKALPRQMDLSMLMNPSRLAETSVDLNLKLMRWRMLPTLKTDYLARTKCLLIGAGTLGCNIARVLLAWGVRTITFIDNSNVSFSNPVRQSLFELSDCLNGGRPKAQAAAEKLKLIFPNVVSAGYKLSIPMPGHAVSMKNTSEIVTVQKDYDTLCELISSHDVIFLGTDTRESRWLPTVIAKALNKLCINTALGFDSYLVMRHPFRSRSTEEIKCGGNTIFPEDVGCYFCADVVAPENSLLDRTLDQMCTVTRPGLAPIASSLAVELMVSMLHKEHDRSEETILGELPHQIRGCLSIFSMTMLRGESFSKCTACSKAIIKEWQSEGFQFLLKACNGPSYLEEITGLLELRNQVDNIDFDMIEDDEDALM